MHRYLRFSLRSLFIFTTLVAVACFVVPRYCINRVTSRNFDRAMDATSREEMERILGPGTVQSPAFPGNYIVRWDSPFGRTTIKVEFKNDEPVRFTWSEEHRNYRPGR